MYNNPKKERKNVYVDKEQYSLFKKSAEILNMSFTEFINQALVEWNEGFGKAAIEGDEQVLKTYFDNLRSKILEFQEQERLKPLQNFKK